jgi:hypothetical protein
VPGAQPIPRPVLAISMGLASLAVVACGDSSAEEERERLADELVTETDGALEPATARCVADDLHDRFGADSFRRLLDATGSDDEADVRREVIEVFARCDALPAIIDDQS